jgi:hypothetical protein
VKPRGRVGATLAAAVMAASRSGAAQPDAPCGSAGRPRVEIAGSGADVAAVAPLLRAQLASRNIDLCPGDGSDAAIAAISVTARPDGATIDVDVRDRLTAKRVSRDVDLSSVPPDGRSLTLAVVADELLRASWAELALASSPPPTRPVPAAIRETLKEGLVARRRFTTRLEALAELETWAGSLTLYGVDLRVAFASESGLGATARIGARGAPGATGPDGQVQATALLGGVGVTLRAVPSGSPVELDAIARVDAVRIAYTAVANAGATSAGLADTTVLIGAGFDAAVPLSASTQIVAEALVDAPLRAVAAVDGGRSVVAASGIGVEGGAGVRVGF